MNEIVPIIILLQEIKLGNGNLIAEWYHVYRLIKSQEYSVLAFVGLDLSLYTAQTGMRKRGNGKPVPNR